MTIAEKVLKLINGASAVTLPGGYAQTLVTENGGNRFVTTRFPAARIIDEKRFTSRPLNGRCYYGLYEYPDRSRIEFTWGPMIGPKYKLLPPPSA